MASFAFPFKNGSVTFLAPKHLSEVCTLSGQVNTPLSTLLPAGICFLRPPLPPYLSASLAECFPYSYGGKLGLPCSAHLTRWVRACLSAGGVLECVEKIKSPLFIPLTFWFKPHSTFGLSSMTTFISSSLMLPIPSFLAPLRLSAARIELASRFTLSASWLRATLSPELHTWPLPATHVRVRNYWHYNRSTLRLTIK